MRYKLILALALAFVAVAPLATPSSSTSYRACQSAVSEDGTCVLVCCDDDQIVCHQFPCP